ncbi:GNAT family N-acetyltransferase [Alkaliphilus hydrothermalis]|uniref:GNAT superfamily N-acetyltransferase n=1 Tax=Alkaliphilus hydrothermalis TaxID=1482730 RepID=A0ABS2NLH8_9FIRM|nr:GNAT family N-acetyltransferase [Alkaliphilus hydrothermalis]MBM7613792.1 GNAT superfamily N-acetyltransferase [Alkaliphilus hydrothermalis]
MEYRELKREELQLFIKIDRREIIEGIYYFRDGELVLEKEYFDVKGFPPDEQEDILERLIKIHEEAGYIAGAFDGDQLVGITSLESKPRGSRQHQLKMDILYINSDYRGKGVGKRLVEMVKDKARDMGAECLYISATPSENTVHFYLGMGCRLAKEVDPELFKLEPLDIHMELPLRIHQHKL